MNDRNFQETVPFSVMAKPVGASCNLNCAYCYYLEKDKIYTGNARQNIMTSQVLESYITQTVYSCRSPVVQFTWHGGEPLLRGLDFFRDVIRLQKKYGAGRAIENSIQTNGTTLTDDWCLFLRDNGFLVGLSIDGPEHCHNRYRRHRDGRGSFDGCLRGAGLLVKHRVEFNTLTVVNDYNALYPPEVYRFLKEIGSRYLQFLPLVERLDPGAGENDFQILPVTSDRIGEVSDRTVDPADYGDFLIRIFDEWVRKDVGEIFVVTFDSVLANWMRVPPPVCVAAPVCGNAGAMEFNGDVYSCDHYVFPEFRLGNIEKSSLAALMHSPGQLKFGRDKRDTLPQYCRRCEFLDLCNGECPKNRIISTPDGEPGLNYLCAGFRKFYAWSEPYFNFMAEQLQKGQPPSNVMKWAAGRKRAI